MNSENRAKSPETSKLMTEKERLQKEVEELNNRLTLLNNELRSKQNVLKGMKGKGGGIAPRPADAVGPPKGNTMSDMIKAKDEQIDTLNAKVISQDHEIRQHKDQLQKLNLLESQLD